MNILPKKRWHVRTKDNIARVRRDEAKAAEEEKIRKQKIQLAEQEARTSLLREKARASYDGRSHDTEEKSEGKKEHVNFFKELEDGEYQSRETNEEYEKEKKETQEKYEKQIGYLSYLVEKKDKSTESGPWYEKTRDRDSTSVFIKEESHVLSKSLIDPLNKFKSIIGSHTHSNSKNKTTSEPTDSKEKTNVKTGVKRLSSSDRDSGSHGNTRKRNDGRSPSMEELKLKRLKREKEEKAKAALFLAKMKGTVSVVEAPPPNPPVRQKYNSQFNPELAKQNSSKYY